MSGTTNERKGPEMAQPEGWTVKRYTTQGTIVWEKQNRLARGLCTEAEYEVEEAEAQAYREVAYRAEEARAAASAASRELHRQVWQANRKVL